VDAATALVPASTARRVNWRMKSSPVTLMIPIQS
jgi:hypothetical protein